MPDFSSLDNILTQAAVGVAPAIVCRVEQHGEVLFEKASGVIDPARHDRPALTGAYFDFASLTKLFTTTACLRLCTEGRLSLDTAVAHVLPAFAGIRSVGPTEDPISKRPLPASTYWTQIVQNVNAGAITVRHLLTHASGLPAWRSVFSACGDTPAPGNTLSRIEIQRRQQCGIEAICGYDFAYPPSLSYIYSDVGLILLGAVVAKIHGNNALDETLAQLVIFPLGLSAVFNPSLEDSGEIAPTEYCPWRGRRLHGEVHDENAAGLGGIAGQAGLFGTAQDLCRLGRLYLNDGEDLLSAGIVRQSIECQIAADSPGDPLPNPDRPCAPPDPEIRRGLGWMLPARGSSCGPEWSQYGFGHTGFTGTSLWCDPEQDLTVALLTNRVYYGRDPDPIHDLRQQVHTAVLRSIRRQ